MKQLKEIDIKAEKIMLKERDTGKEALFTIRPFETGDEEGVMACVKDEYGDSYFKKFFYDKEKLKEKIETGYCDIFVAEIDGKIAGIEILSYSDCGDSYIEPASQILNHKYRGYGLSKAMVVYTFKIIEALEPTCMFVHAVTFHDMTQKTCQKAGMIPVGFRIGSFLSENMENSYQKKRCEKYSEGILIKAIAKRDAGKVYLPEELVDFGHKIYERLGVKYEIISSDTFFDKDDFKCREKGKYIIHIDDLQRFIRIQVKEDGLDLKEEILSLINKYKGLGKWSLQVALNSDTPLIYKQYGELKELGLYFTGIKPLCSDREQIYMQWVDDWKLYTEDYVLTKSFEEIRVDIDKFYERR